MEQDEIVPTPLPPQEFVAAVTASENYAQELDGDRLALIGADVCREKKIDEDSMGDWLQSMKRGIELAKLVKEDKTYPYKNAANIKYPLVTSAALQFNARSYPAIVASDRIVKGKVYGEDAQGQKAARAERVSAHMSWQLGSQMPDWEENTDKLLVQLPIVGTMVRKVWYDVAQGRTRNRLVDAGDFFVNNKVKALDDAPRCSEVLRLYPYEVQERVKSGQYIDVDMDIGDDSQEIQDFIEQHTRIDLDDDGYAEPYIVTVHVKSEKVVRLVADFNEEDVTFDTETVMVLAVTERQDPWTGNPVMVEQMQPQEQVTGIKSIRRGSYFVDYHFLPSMDGGFFGTGLGILLGDISDTINATINMLLDAGKYAALGGGWIGSQFRLKGGNNTFSPGEWKTVEATGPDIRTSVVPMTYPGPDATLFQLLGLLIDAGREIASVQDIMTGDAGNRQMTATTTLALIEQGMQVFTAAYKRIFRSLKKEFGLMAAINAKTVSPEEYNAFHDGQEQYDPQQEYLMADMDVEPVADPRSVTKMQEMAKAQLLMEMGQSGMVNQAAAADRVLQAADIGDREELAIQPDPMQEQMTQMGLKDAEAGLVLRMIEIEQALADIEETRSKAMKNLTDAGATEANVRLDVLKTRLEAMRDGLGDIIRQGSGRMAGASGDGASAPMSPGFIQGPAARGPQQLLGGSGMAPGSNGFTQGPGGFGG